MEIVTENPVSLAWIGDAVFTLKVREHVLAKGIQKPAAFEKAARKYNSAKGQARILSLLEERNFFSEDEKEILRRGRNANVKTTAKNADRSEYMKATAFEALLGYLKLYGHEERLQDLLALCLQLGDEL